MGSQEETDSGQGDGVRMALITVQIDKDFSLCPLQKLTFQREVRPQTELSTES